MISSGRVREWSLRTVILVGSVFACLALLEGIVRVIEPREVMRYFFVEPDNTLHHKFIPNAKGQYKTTEFDTHYRIDSLGLRDREYSIQKPRGVYRILMLGDSYTEGDGVEANQTFSKLVELDLNGAGSDQKYQVINAGCGSYSPLLEYLYLKTYGLRLNPDLVILNLDLSDFYDDIQYTALARFDSNGTPLGVSPDVNSKDGGWFIQILTTVKDFLKEHTRLYNFIRLRISRYVEGARHEGVSLGDIRYDKYWMLRDNDLSKGQDVSLTQHYIVMVRQMLRDRGIPFMVALYPYGLQVSAREYRSGREFWGFRPDTVYSIHPQAQMELFCRREGIPVVNSCEEFRRAALTQFPLYLDYNGHWTPAGHKVFSEVLHREIEKQFGIK